MTNLHPVGNTVERVDRLVDVVFVHGAGGHPYNSWGQMRTAHGGEKDSMPHWLLEDFPWVGVWTLEHESDKTRWPWRPGRSIQRTNLDSNIFEVVVRCLGMDKLPAGKAKRSLCWVAHCQGGDAVKSLLQYCKLETKQCLSDPASLILEASKWIFFIDTPHRGVWFLDPLLNVLDTLAPPRASVATPKVRELREADPALIERTNWFVGNLEDMGIECYNFYQASGLFKIVGKASAELPVPMPGRNIAIAKDHNQMAKPCHRQEAPYPQISRSLSHLVSGLAAPSQDPDAEAPVKVQPLKFKSRLSSAAARLPDPGRLLLFMTADQIRKDKYNMRIWHIEEKEELPCPRNALPDADLSWQQLPEAILKAWSECSKSRPERRLLVILFVPVKLLGNACLDELLVKLRDLSPDMRKEHCPASIGVPFVLACGSRYQLVKPATGLEATVSQHLELSQQLEQAFLIDDSHTLSSLEWLLIDDDDPSAPGASPTPNAASSLQESCGRMTGVELDDQIGASWLAGKTDPLQERQALYLHWQRDLLRRSPGCYEKRMHYLMERAIPFIWRDAPALPIPGVANAEELKVVPTERGSPRHPFHVILDWDSTTFLDRYYRWSSRTLPQQEEDCRKEYLYLRRSVLFWEDHRYTSPLREAARPLRSSDTLTLP